MGFGGHVTTTEEENTPFDLTGLLRTGGQYYLGQEKH